MNRKEGIDLLTKILSDFDLDHENGYTYRHQAKYVMEQMMEAGFKPPYNAKGLSSYDIAMGSDVNKWEDDE